MNKYTQIPPQELAACAAAGRPQDNIGECVMPVPQDTPPMPERHWELGKPLCRWPYPNENGALLFEVWRFEMPDGKKEIRPLSLWRDASGCLKWKWKSIPEPRPLYGLDKLAARPEVPVIVCEGEKSADAAAKIFPESVAVTSPGGSQAASKAEWAPLAGRKARRG
jgi:putative DNA primase/helicase